MPDARHFADSPEQVGVDSKRLEALFARAEREVREGLLPSVQIAVARAGKVFNILKIQSLNPQTLRASMDLYLATMKGPSGLSRAEREMLGTIVSWANHCFY